MMPNTTDKNKRRLGALLSALVVAVFLGAPHLKGKMAAAKLVREGGKEHA